MSCVSQTLITQRDLKKTQYTTKFKKPWIHNSLFGKLHTELIFDRLNTQLYLKKTQKFVHQRGVLPQRSPLPMRGEGKSWSAVMTLGRATTGCVSESPLGAIAYSSREFVAADRYGMRSLSLSLSLRLPLSLAFCRLSVSHSFSFSFAGASWIDRSLLFYLSISLSPFNSWQFCQSSWCIGSVGVRVCV